MNALIVVVVATLVAAAFALPPELSQEFTCSIVASSNTSSAGDITASGFVAVDAHSRSIWQSLTTHLGRRFIRRSRAVLRGSCRYLYHDNGPSGGGGECAVSHKDDGDFFVDLLIPENATFAGVAKVNGVSCDKWAVAFDERGKATTLYYVAPVKEGASLHRLVRVVQNNYYQSDFVNCDFGRPSPSSFEVPAQWNCSICDVNPPFPHFTQYGKAAFVITGESGATINGTLAIDYSKRKAMQTFDSGVSNWTRFHDADCAFEYANRVCSVTDNSFDEEFTMPAFASFLKKTEVRGKKVTVWRAEDDATTFYIAEPQDGVSVFWRVEYDTGTAIDFASWSLEDPGDELKLPSAWNCPSIGSCATPAAKRRRRVTGMRLPLFV